MSWPKKIKYGPLVFFTKNDTATAQRSIVSDNFIFWEEKIINYELRNNSHKDNFLF